LKIQFYFPKMRRGTGLPRFTKKQDIKSWCLWITTVLCFFCLPASVVFIIILSRFNFNPEKVVQASQPRLQNIEQSSEKKSTCKSWCERDVSTWDWVSDEAESLVAGKSEWTTYFRRTNMLVDKREGSCCLSTDGMKGYVYGCRWVGKDGAITFNPYMHQMVNQTVAVLPSAKRAVVLGLGLGGIPQILVNSWKHLTVDVVEVNKYVVDAAKEAFCFPDEKRIQVILEDVFKWIASAQESTYDVVYIDIFDGKVMPLKAKKKKFFQEVARILKPSGLTTSNVLFKDLNYLKNLSKYFKSCSVYKRRYITCIK
jgi:SAM-dependent methyltransferase